MADPAYDAIIIRPWDRRDHGAVQRLLRLLSTDAEVTSADAPAYVAVSGERIVGMVTLCVYCTLTGPKAYLDHLVVDPDWRRRGIARRLVRHAIDKAAAAGASRVDLTASDTKQAGRALYESLGFQQRETQAFRLLLGGTCERAGRRAACRSQPGEAGSSEIDHHPCDT